MEEKKKMNTTQQDEGKASEIKLKKKKPKATEDEAADVGEKLKKTKKKRDGAVDDPGRESRVQDAEELPKKKKKRVEVVEPQGSFRGSPVAYYSGRQTDPDMTDSDSLYEDPDETESPAYFGTNPMQEYRPPTRTGISELPVKDFFLMVLLWSPRFFGPWMTAWHEFNVFILARPDHLESKAPQFLMVDLVVFGVSCAVSILVSIIADLASMRYYVYLIFLFLYTLCPIAGGAVDVVLRFRMYDNEIYDNWFLSIILMRSAMAIPFIFFPVQFTCIFTEKANMSRQAHYNWTAFFAFLEFVNAYASFWVIPPKCPTSEWNQMAVWMVIFALLWLLIVATITFSIIVKSIRYTMMTCLRTCGLQPEKYLDDEYDQKIFEDKIPVDLRLRKLKWFGLMLLPLVFTSFVFATLERFVPDEDWDKHYVLSATSMFYLGRIIGVVLMAVVLYWIRHGFQRVLRIPIFRGDVLVLGLPHFFNILALLTLVGRFATLSNLSPGDVIQGPIPDETKTVVLYINQMFRNKTVCVHSDHFRPVKIRTFHYNTREIYDSGTDQIDFTVIPEPGTYPPVTTSFALNHFKTNSLIIFSVNLFSYLNKKNEFRENKYREYMNKPRVIRHYGSDKYRPQGEPGLILINNIFYALNKKLDPESGLHFDLIYLFGYGAKPTRFNFTYFVQMCPDDGTLFYRPPLMGKWYVSITTRQAIDQPTNDTYNSFFTGYTEEFMVDNFTLYVVSAYFIEPLNSQDKTNQLRSVRVKVYPIGRITGQDDHHLPTKRVLQRDWVIQTGMTLAGVSAGGLFAGTVYLFWMDPPFPEWQTTALAVFWTLMIGAAESPKVKLVDIGIIVSSVLLVVQVGLTCVHVLASMMLYTPRYNFRKRPD